MRLEYVNENRIDSFIDFPDKLYEGDPFYTPYIKADLRKTLKKLLVEDKTYKAIQALSDKGEVLGQVLFTIDKDKHFDTDKCGFFSMYECIDDLTVSRAILSEMTEALRHSGAEYITGTYFPYDQDNRRGIMVEGFDREPVLFTSYNKPYYQDQMLDAGFEKQIDTLSFALYYEEKMAARLKKIGDYSKKRYNFRVDTASMKTIDKDIEDFTSVMAEATNSIVYQEAPPKETILQFFNEWKRFIDLDLVFIARDNETNRPVGIVLMLPDYYQLFRKMKGKLNLKGLFILLTERKKIDLLRAMLQYVVPEYQKKGVLAAMYSNVFDYGASHNIRYAEAGTIMENNRDSIDPLLSVGSVPSHTYRLFYRKF